MLLDCCFELTVLSSCGVIHWREPIWDNCFYNQIICSFCSTNTSIQWLPPWLFTYEAPLLWLLDTSSIPIPLDQAALISEAAWEWRMIPGELYPLEAASAPSLDPWYLLILSTDQSTIRWDKNIVTIIEYTEIYWTLAEIHFCSLPITLSHFFYYKSQTNWFCLISIRISQWLWILKTFSRW